jgi:Phosphate-starvation-inducible E family
VGHPKERFLLIIEARLTKVQKFTVLVLAGMLIVVMVLSTIHLGVLICHEIWAPPRFLIRVEGLLEIFGYFLLVLIGIEVIEALKAYVKNLLKHRRVTRIRFAFPAGHLPASATLAGMIELASCTAMPQRAGSGTR